MAVASLNMAQSQGDLGSIGLGVSVMKIRRLVPAIATLIALSASACVHQEGAASKDGIQKLPDLVAPFMDVCFPPNASFEARKRKASKYVSLTQRSSVEVAEGDSRSGTLGIELEPLANQCMVETPKTRYWGKEQAMRTMSLLQSSLKNAGASGVTPGKGIKSEPFGAELESYVGQIKADIYETTFKYAGKTYNLWLGDHAPNTFSYTHIQVVEKGAVKKAIRDAFSGMESLSKKPN